MSETVPAPREVVEAAIERAESARASEFVDGEAIREQERIERADALTTRGAARAAAWAKACACGKPMAEEQTTPVEEAPSEPKVERRGNRGWFAPGNQIGRMFPPGLSGNPNGRPRKNPVDIKLRELLLARMNEPWTGPVEAKRALNLREDCTIGEAYAAMLVANAMKPRPSPTAIREVNERLWGKTPLPVKIGGPTEDDESMGELRIVLVGDTQEGAGASTSSALPSPEGTLPELPE